MLKLMIQRMLNTQYIQRKRQTMSIVKTVKPNYRWKSNISKCNNEVTAQRPSHGDS